MEKFSLVLIGYNISYENYLQIMSICIKGTCMGNTFQITLESMLVQKCLTAMFINSINLLHPLVKQGIDIKNRVFYIQIRLMSMND